MKRSRFALIFLIITIALLFVNVALIIIFNIINMEDKFYDSLNVASLSIAFLSFIASSFFSLSVYLQSKTQSKINDSLPKKDDQYIIANYALFNIEKEISIFEITGDEKENILNNKKYLLNEFTKDNLTRLVFLPTNTINAPIYKVFAKKIKFYSSKKELLMTSKNTEGLDCEYSANILQRGYNCICVDILDELSSLLDVFKKTYYIELDLDVISVFNVNMSITYNIYLNGEKDVTDNPDKNILHDLRTFNIHHSNYVIENKCINTRKF